MPVCFCYNILHKNVIYIYIYMCVCVCVCVCVRVLENFSVQRRYFSNVLQFELLSVIEYRYSIIILKVYQFNLVDPTRCTHCMWHIASAYILRTQSSCCDVAHYPSTGNYSACPSLSVLRQRRQFSCSTKQNDGFSTSSLCVLPPSE